METFEVGDLVRDKLNKDDSSYGLGVVVTVDSERILRLDPSASRDQPLAEHAARAHYGKTIAEIRALALPGKRYDVYFTKFERTITFHGDYLQKV